MSSAMVDSEYLRYQDACEEVVWLFLNQNNKKVKRGCLLWLGTWPSGPYGVRPPSYSAAILSLYLWSFGPKLRSFPRTRTSLLFSTSIRLKSLFMKDLFELFPIINNEYRTIRDVYNEYCRQPIWLLVLSIFLILIKWQDLIGVENIF